MNKLPSLVLGLGLVLVPTCVSAQNTPSSQPLSGTPSDAGNELVDRGGVGTRAGTADGWHRYLPNTPTGWGALLIGTAAVSSFAWRRLND